MPRPCTICANGNRDAIEAELGSGAPLRFTARQFQVSPSALFRHKEHALASLKAPAQAQLMTHSDSHQESLETEEPAVGLTIKQKLFVEHYLATRNGTLAAGLAGYSGDNHQLSVTASRTLGNASVRAEIDRRIKPLVLSANEVLELLSAQANASMDSLLTDGVLDLDKARENGSMRLIKKLHFSKDTGRITTVELHDAQAAAIHVGRKHKLFTDKVDVDTPASRNEAEIRERIVKETAEKCGITEQRAREIVDDVCGQPEIDGDAAPLIG